jgi:hypothetical protein
LVYDIEMMQAPSVGSQFPISIYGTFSLLLHRFTFLWSCLRTHRSVFEIEFVSECRQTDSRTNEKQGNKYKSRCSDSRAHLYGGGAFHAAVVHSYEQPRHNGQLDDDTAIVVIGLSEGQTTPLIDREEYTNKEGKYRDLFDLIVKAQQQPDRYPKQDCHHEIALFRTVSAAEQRDELAKVGFFLDY